MTPKKKRVIKAYALMDDGKLSHCYGLAYICFTKRQAEIEAESKNRIPFADHNMTVEPCTITLGRGR